MGDALAPGRVVDPANITGDLGAILLAHARAADRELHRACRPLSDAQLDHPFAMGPGSIRAALMHNLGAVRVWADQFARRPARPWLPDEGPLTIEAMEAIAEVLYDDWDEIVTRFPLDETLERTRSGVVQRFTRAHILVHTTTHSVHHRAQIINMLRQIGVEDRPTGSAMVWAVSLALPA